MFLGVGDKRDVPPPKHTALRVCFKTAIKKGSSDFKNGFLNSPYGTFPPERTVFKGPVS